ncbi:hypothetical protein [Cytobacillus firmus]|uniref:hypothetical protein n=1 Tax=Cytobacillus firmus TaxID=1399 RepID=UPI002030F575|nr:hypothetical protein [Cytobacillus firmus]URT70521.1 hypothetical protein NAF01_22510 [Cytobacillus firmus]
MFRRNVELYSYTFNGHKFILKTKYISQDPMDFIDINYKWVLSLPNKDCIPIKTVDKEITQSQLDSFEFNVHNQLPMFDSKVFVQDVLRKITILEKGLC